MIRRNALYLAVCAAALGSFGCLASAHAQGQAPFTIAKPPDGAQVREKVKIEIPRASIPTGGFVAIYLDGQFHMALAPEEGSEDRFFTFLWDTKGSGVSDGEHTVRAVLFGPVSENTTAATEKGASEVKLTVANKIHDGPSSLLLRYKYREGETLEYGRDGKSIIVGGVSQTGTTTSDQEMASVRSRLEMSVEDVRYDNDAQSEVALVRNKLTSLSVLQGGQEVSLDPSQLSGSMYQELLPQGRPIYEIGAATGLAEFTSQGLVVDNTLELPLLPTGRVQVGDTWNTPNQRIDIPGVPPILQPRVTLHNKLEDLEWESSYPTAKVHQSLTIEGLPKDVKSVLFGPVEITSPTIKFERDIYLAYNSGILVKLVRNLTVSGRTTSQIGAPPPPQSGGPGMFNQGMGAGSPYGGMSNRFGSNYGKGEGGQGMPSVSGGMTPGSGSPYGGFPRTSGGGYPGAPGGFPGAPGSGSPYGGPPGVSGGMVPGGGFPRTSGGGYPGMSGGSPYGGGGYPGGSPYSGANPGGGSLYSGGVGAPADHAITLRATTETQLTSAAGMGGVATTATPHTTHHTSSGAAKSQSRKAVKRHH